METTLSKPNGLRIGKLVSPSGRVEVPLAKGEILKLEGDQRGVVLISSAGSLWITQEGDPYDYVLACGERFVINRRGKVLVQGQPEGRVRIPANFSGITRSNN